MPEYGIQEDVSREDGLEISIEFQYPEEISRKKGKSHNYVKRLFQDHCIIRVTTSGLFFPFCADQSRQRIILQGNNSRFVR